MPSASSLLLRNRKSRPAKYFFLTFVLFMSASLFAQSTTDGAVSGTVYDPHGAVLSGATVVVRNNGTNTEQTVTTDSSGFYRVAKLQPATYTVTVTASGFSNFRAEQVIVEVGR